MDASNYGKIALKYFALALSIILVSNWLQKGMGRIDFNEILMISAVGAASFFILDTFAPSVSGAMRSGAGFGMGINMVGVPYQPYMVPPSMM